MTLNTQSDLNLKDHIIELSHDQPTQIFPPLCDTNEFIQHVVQIVRARERKKLWILFFIILLLILLIAICFICTVKYNTFVIFPAVILIIAVFILTILVFVSCCEYSFLGENHLKLIGNVQHVWQLTNEIWNKQIDELQTVPSKLIGFCNDRRYQRLKNRLYGNIIITQKGILIDELYLIDYGEVFISHIAPITDDNGSVILRMYLNTRCNFETNFSSGKPKEFNFDLIIPSNFQGQELFDLYQQILSQSRICPVNFRYELASVFGLL